MYTYTYIYIHIYAYIHVRQTSPLRKAPCRQERPKSTPDNKTTSGLHNNTYILQLVRLNTA